MTKMGKIISVSISPETKETLEAIAIVDENGRVWVRRHNEEPSWKEFATPYSEGLDWELEGGK